MELLFASYVLVLIKVIQQRNVMNGAYVAVFCTSWIFAAAEILLIVNVVATNGFSAWLQFGAGASFGAITGLWIHKRIAKKNVDF